MTRSTQVRHRKTPSASPGKTDKAAPNNMKFKVSSVQPAPGGKKKQRNDAAAGERSSKITSSFVPDFSKMPDGYKLRGIGSVAVTHDHWADLNTSKSWVQDILIPY